MAFFGVGAQQLKQILPAGNDVAAHGLSAYGSLRVQPGSQVQVPRAVW